MNLEQTYKFARLANLLFRNGLLPSWGTWLVWRANCHIEGMQAVANLVASVQAGTVNSSSTQQSSDAPEQSFLQTLQTASGAGSDQGQPLTAPPESAGGAAKMVESKSGSERKKSADDSDDDSAGTPANSQDQNLIALSAAIAAPTQSLIETVSAQTLSMQASSETASTQTVPAQAQGMTIPAQTLPVQAPSETDSTQATPTQSETISAQSVLLPEQSETASDLNVLDSSFTLVTTQVENGVKSASQPMRVSDGKNTAQLPDMAIEQAAAPQSLTDAPISNETATSEIQRAPAQLSKALAEIQSILSSSSDAGDQVSATVVDNAVQSTSTTFTTDLCAANAQTFGQSQLTKTAADSGAIISLLNAGQQPKTTNSVAGAATNTVDTESAPTVTDKIAPAPVMKKAVADAVSKQVSSEEQGNQQENVTAVAHSQLQGVQSDSLSQQQSSASIGDSRKQSDPALKSSSQEEKNFTRDLTAATGQAVSASAAATVEQSQVSSPKASVQYTVTAAEPEASTSTVQESATQVSSAKLIQSASQTEMRVGMHSSEFGNISISASSTRDTIAAQISVDHTELAKTLNAQLTDFQSKSSSVQMEVQVNMHGSGSSTTSNQSFGGQAGTMGGSASQSNSDSRQSSQLFGSNSTATADSTEPQIAAGLMVAQFSNQSTSINGRLDVSA